MYKDIITILNYPGSKKRLLEFIDDTIEKVLPKNKTILDVFSGTSSVAYSLKDNYCVIANDAEIYCYEIGKALLENNEKLLFSDISNVFWLEYKKNYNILYDMYPEVLNEAKIIDSKDACALSDFNKCFLNIWQEKYYERKHNSEYCLFTKYYSNSYFGLNQAIEIDSLRFAIDRFTGSKWYDILLVCLYYAMKEAVFSKDGHMAQPLNIDTNKSVLLKRRGVSIVECFKRKIIDFESENFVIGNINNKAYNMTLESLLESNILESVDLVYADPPYTDMQYSRYFHLLETLTKYDYPLISRYRGKISSGLYREERFQSPLSQRGKAKKDIEKLIKKCASLKKYLVFSYAYPVDLDKQKSDRYIMSIDELIQLFKKYYGQNISILSEEFFHANNRNSESKKVYEYLIVGGARINEC